MHLNRECRAPRLTNLFTRTDVTDEVEALQCELPNQLRSMRRMLGKPMPEVEAGGHCSAPYACPFFDRCNPPVAEHHVSTLHGMRPKKLASLLEDGYESIHDLTEEHVFAGAAARQVEAVKRNRTVVSSELALVLARVGKRIAFLDFETIALPIPLWAGTRPYDAVPVQFSVHMETSSGFRHHAWLADSGSDPRPDAARNLVHACAGAATILVYHAQFERQRIHELMEAVPALARELGEVAARMEDMLPWVRDHVYHPSINGSFSLKVVGPALLGDDVYDGLEIRDGQSASNALELLLLRPETLDEQQRLGLRRALLAYCEQDTLVLVRLLARLRELAGVATTVMPRRVGHGVRTITRKARA